MRGPGGMGGMDMGKLMKQAQKMQEAMLKMQEDLGSQVVEGTAGGGAVTIRISASMEVQSVKIKPEAVDPDDVETLEDLVLAAMKDGMGKASAIANNQMNAITGGMKLPGF